MKAKRLKRRFLLKLNRTPSEVCVRVLACLRAHTDPTSTLPTRTVIRNELFRIIIVDLASHVNLSRKRVLVSGGVLDASISTIFHRVL